MRAPFSVIEPAGEETPLIVEIPHAGLWLDGPSLATLAAPARSIGRDADLWVDELYADAPARGATMIVAHVSRYVVDLNRSETDVDAESVEGAPPTARATRGIVWRLTSEGKRVLDAPLPRREFERRVDTFYRPYHAAIAALIERKRARFGHAILVAGHSMPSVGRAAHGDAHAHRADVVPGTRGRTSASARFIDAVDAFARDAGFSVSHDDPYQGGFTTMHYGRPKAASHVVQVELSRRLYMDETTLQKNAGFDRVRAFCGDLVARLGAIRP
ncbi:MAG: N-formylglutamate amidohydrolase [Labilithrix sp.]|nr:N-formylglutamate amidohydrolase [Labilithrix sp.]MCW5837034.1 N-formylglutamate amidohydrolase [Labilithrix sp.]